MSACDNCGREACAASESIPLHRHIELGAKLACERAARQRAEARLAVTEAALAKINGIRNSIVGEQGFNFSEHAYPLVAALDEAGIEGEGYPKSRENFGTMLDRTNRAERERDEIRAVLRDYVERENVTHDGDCSEAEDCNCSAAPLIVRINAARAIPPAKGGSNGALATAPSATASEDYADEPV